jgi:hypothetical protein
MSFLATSILFSTLAFAANFSGKLIDANCHEQKKTACDATGTTTAFALDVSGKVYKLDTAGNSLASQAIKNRADRADPNKAQSTAVMANAAGTESSGTIAVESLEVQ